MAQLSVPLLDEEILNTSRKMDEARNVGASDFQALSMAISDRFTDGLGRTFHHRPVSGSRVYGNENTHDHRGRASRL